MNRTMFNEHGRRVYTSRRERALDSAVRVWRASARGRQTIAYCREFGVCCAPIIEFYCCVLLFLFLLVNSGAFLAYNTLLFR